jgi:hypothetical protein
VFAALSDSCSELEWNPKLQLMQRIDDGPLGVGSKFRAKWKLSKPLTLEVTRYDAPNGWSYTNDRPIEVDLDLPASHPRPPATKHFPSRRGPIAHPASGSLEGCLGPAE